MRTVPPEYFEMRNGVCITTNPAWSYHEQYQCREKYQRNTEPQFMIMLPDIERYSSTLEDARRLVSDKRKIRGISRRCARRSKENGIPF